jgi:hypothetical protein
MANKKLPIFGPGYVWAGVSFPNRGGAIECRITFAGLMGQLESFLSG